MRACVRACHGVQFNCNFNTGLYGSMAAWTWVSCPAALKDRRFVEHTSAARALAPVPKQKRW